MVVTPTATILTITIDVGKPEHVHPSQKMEGSGVTLQPSSCQLGNRDVDVTEQTVGESYEGHGDLFTCQ